MTDLDLRKRIELELLRFALKYAEKEEIGGRLMINTEAENYIHKEIPVQANRNTYLQFYGTHKMQRPPQLMTKIELYMKARCNE